MITKIELSEIASFGPGVVMLNLDAINYIFGSNGSGKTTISREIEKNLGNVSWHGGNKMKTDVYNTDFVEKNFLESETVDDIPGTKGIFTLGKDDVSIRLQIDNAKVEKEKIDDEINNLKVKRDEKKEEQQKLKEEFKDECWNKKDEHKAVFPKMFVGMHGSKEKFLEFILGKSKVAETAVPTVFDDLKSIYDNLFVKELKQEDKLDLPDESNLLQHENSEILTKIITGKQDIGFAKLIKTLDNSRWVREGYDEYYDSEKRVCPFCQQVTTDNLIENLKMFFDESYDRDIEAISAYQSSYTEAYESFVLLLEKIENSKFIDKNSLDGAKKELVEAFKDNIEIIEKKKKIPDGTVELKPLASIINKIKSVVESANHSIEQNNKTVKDKESQTTQFANKFWHWFLKQLAGLTSYLKNDKKISEKIGELNSKIQSTMDEKEKKENEITELEKNTMSVQTTVDEINKILSSIGFSGFSLSTYGSKQQYYKIKRPGSDDNAFKSLSEGEKNLVTLLYFTYSLRGSTNEDEIEKDRVAVFDDPVSSLDSENLYYASSLIRNIIEDVQKGQNIVKQVFVMTHNVYFHKEITLSHVRKSQAPEKYWIVKKVDGISNIEHKDKNPISSVFELLWMEYIRYKREPAKHHFITIQNIMRRILEYYFKVLNGIDLHKISDEFDEPDKSAFRSLIDWVHAGSHVPPEDHDPNNANLKEHYCNAFEEIFRKSGFKEHYELVMKRLNDRV